MNQERLRFKMNGMHPLYNLSPIGFGTSQAESLASYDCRLANAHCVPVHTLNRLVLFQHPSSLKARILDASWNGSSHVGRMMVQIGTVSKSLATALNMATGRNDLIAGTLNFASGFLSTNLLHANDARYCRECLRDAVAANREPWLPLLWSIGVVTACPIHQLKLRTRKCGALENAVHLSMRKILPESCWVCGSRFCLCDKSRSVGATSEEVAVAELVGELIEVGSSGIGLPFDALQLCNESMPKILGRNWLIRSASASGVQKGNVHRMFRQPGARTSLPVLVRFCVCNQLSLAKMAMGEVEYRYCENPSYHMSRPYRSANAELIRGEIERATNTNSSQSLRDLSRKLHHDPETLEAAAPELVRALKLANAALRVAERNIRAAKQEEECRKVIETLRQHGFSLTLAHAQELTGVRWHSHSQRARVFLRMRRQHDVYH